MLALLLESIFTMPKVPYVPPSAPPGYKPLLPPYDPSQPPFDPRRGT